MKRESHASEVPAQKRMGDRCPFPGKKVGERETTRTPSAATPVEIPLQMLINLLVASSFNHFVRFPLKVPKMGGGNRGRTGLELAFRESFSRHKVWQTSSFTKLMASSFLGCARKRQRASQARQQDSELRASRFFGQELREHAVLSFPPIGGFPSKWWFGAESMVWFGRLRFPIYPPQEPGRQIPPIQTTNSG